MTSVFASFSFCYRLGLEGRRTGPTYSSRVSWHQNNPPISCEIPSLVCLCQLVGCFIGWFCRLGARLGGLLVAKETPPKATSIHPQVHIAPFSILVKNLQNAPLDITTKDITRERSLQPTLPDVTSFETLQN